jgi:hypothetical protein
MQLEERPIHWHWREIQIDAVAEYPTEEPEEPELGCGWYDPVEHCLCIWDGIEWMCVPLD